MAYIRNLHSAQLLYMQCIMKNGLSEFVPNLTSFILKQKTKDKTMLIAQNGQEILDHIQGEDLEMTFPPRTLTNNRKDLNATSCPAKIDCLSSTKHVLGSIKQATE